MPFSKSWDVIGERIFGYILRHRNHAVSREDLNAFWAVSNEEPNTFSNDS